MVSQWSEPTRGVLANAIHRLAVEVELADWLEVLPRLRYLDLRGLERGTLGGLRNAGTVNFQFSVPGFGSGRGYESRNHEKSHLTEGLVASSTTSLIVPAFLSSAAPNARPGAVSRSFGAVTRLAAHSLDRQYTSMSSAPVVGGRQRGTHPEQRGGRLGNCGESSYEINLIVFEIIKRRRRRPACQWIASAKPSRSEDFTVRRIVKQVREDRTARYCSAHLPSVTNHPHRRLQSTSIP